jgi:nucleoside-diphosphate-sugar epimerase
VRLAQQGVRVRALVRNPARARFLTDAALPMIEVVEGDLTAPASLAAAAQGCTTVFHCAALLGGRIDEQHRVNVEGTRVLVEAAAAARIARFVHVSTLSVYGVMYRGQITEALPPAPGSDPYGITKAEAEAVVQQHARRQGLAYSILRPGMIYGARAGLWTGTLFRLASLNPLPWFGDGGGLAHCIHVDDVLEMMLVLATHDNAIGETFNCCNDPSPTWRVFLGHYAHLAHPDSHDWLELPPLLLYAIAGVVMLAAPAHSRARMLPDFARFVLARAQFSMEKARRLLGWQPQVTVAEGVAGCADWLRSEGLLKAEQARG